MGMGEWEPWALRYPSVFGTVRGLPPKRRHDHRIPLVLGNGPVDVKPY